MARIGVALDPDAQGRGSVDRQPPARRDLPRDGGRRQARDHGRADRVADPPRGRRAAAARRRSEASRHLHRLRLAPARRGAWRSPSASPCCATAPRSATSTAREMDDKKLATLMTGKAFAYETARADFARRETVLSVAPSDARRPVRGRQPRHSRRRDRRPDRPARLRPHRTRAVAVRHEPADVGRDPARRQAAGAEDQCPGDRRRHRLRVRGSPEPRPGAGAADLLEHPRHRARQARRTASGLVTEATRQRTRAQMDRRPRDQGAEPRQRRCRRFRAATSSASCSPNGWRPTRSC